jgi:hypothetical protein
MKSARLASLGLVLSALLIALAWSEPRIALAETRDIGSGVTVTREGKLCVVRVPRRSGVRLRAVLADEKRQRLLGLADIASSALAAVNGDYHWLKGPRYARTYSPLVTDGRVAWVASASESFWLDEQHVPHVGPPSAHAWLAIGTGPRLLERGEVTAAVLNEKKMEGWVSRYARTAVGFDARTIYLVATPQESGARLSMKELAAAMKKLGCQEALNLDGGPSTSLVVKGALANVPEDGEERVNTVASALLVLAPDGSVGVN